MLQDVIKFNNKDTVLLSFRSRIVTNRDERLRVVSGYRCWSVTSVGLYPHSG